MEFLRRSILGRNQDQDSIPQNLESEMMNDFLTFLAAFLLTLGIIGMLYLAVLAIFEKVETGRLSKMREEADRKRSANGDTDYFVLSDKGFSPRNHRPRRAKFLP